MKKAAALIFLLYALSFLSASVLSADEIKNWKGRTTGAHYFPSWLESLVEGDENLTRKKFDVSDDDKIIFETASDRDLDTAKALAKRGISNRSLALSGESHVTEVNGLERIFEHWILFSDDKGEHYTVYLVYKKLSAEQNK